MTVWEQAFEVDRVIRLVTFLPWVQISDKKKLKRGRACLEPQFEGVQTILEGKHRATPCLSAAQEGGSTGRENKRKVGL